MFRKVWVTGLLLFSLQLQALDRLKVAESPELVSPLLNGQFVPDVVVQTEFGKDIRLLDIVGSRPCVILFYRGGWCPYCNRQMAGLMEVEQRIIDLGYQIIAISPDTPDKLSSMKFDTDMDVVILSDAKLKAIRGFGLGYYVPESAAKMYKEKAGARLVTLEGSERFVLPVPAAFVVDTSGLIKFQYVNPNYKVRVEPQLLYYAARIAR